MRALRYYGKRDVRIDNVAEPGDPGPGEAVIAPAFVGICGTDLHEYVDGPRLTPVTPHPLTGAQLPQILGHELSAHVVAVGADVEDLAPGDRVSMMPLVVCGRCSACIRGHPERCALRAAVGLRHPWGGMAERTLVAAGQLTRLPDAVTLQQGALIEPTAVAASAVSAARMEGGEHVLVTGAGPIGALATIVALAGGAGSVTVSEPDRRRRAVAERLGAQTLDPTAVDVVATLHDRHGDGVDVVMECAGRAIALQAGIAALRPGGVLVQAGLITEPVDFDAATLMLRGLTVVGTVGFPLDAWPDLLGRVADGKLALDPIVTGTIELDAAPDGFARLAAGGSGDVKMLVEVGA